MKIKRPNLGYIVNAQDFNIWFDTHVEPINKLLSEGVEYYSTRSDGSSIWTINQSVENDRFMGLLINIEPIKKETAEDLLREFISAYSEENLDSIEFQNDLYQRAKALLEKK